MEGSPNRELLHKLRAVLDKLRYMEEKLVRIETKVHLIGEAMDLKFLSKEDYDQTKH
jgi:hypothetical protein